MNRVTLIGFGEAGQAFAEHTPWSAFDIIAEKSRSNSLAEALAGSNIVLSVVSADQALSAATAAATLIEKGTLFCDMNSVAPGTKQESARLIEAAGGHYLDVAVMSPVEPARLAVPLLVSGPHSAQGVVALGQLGFSNVRTVGDTVGRASTIKMLRSVMYKGMEALTAECLIACTVAGVTEEVLRSFGDDWATGADYRLDRMMVHGRRRSAEMEEVVKTLDTLGVVSAMTRGTVVLQRSIGSLDIKCPPIGLDAKLKRLSKA
jgi:3-hydroxyisobutyrate dehydrogenase-like beta-hydroxyacid dehydrogenase